MVTIKNIVDRFRQIQTIDGRLNAFGSGPMYDLQDDIKYYPYLWCVDDIPHDVIYTEINKYRAVEYNFILRVGDKVNDQKNVYMAYGDNSNNGLDSLSDTFTILLDIINVISEDSLGLFPDLALTGDISVEPFHNEESGDVNGHQALITLRTKIENPCISPLTDN